MALNFFARGHPGSLAFLLLGIVGERWVYTYLIAKRGAQVKRKVLPSQDQQRRTSTRPRLLTPCSRFSGFLSRKGFAMRTSLKAQD